MDAKQRRLLILSSLGGILEFYDFIIYALFASYLSNAFFPTTNALLGLIITFATFALGYLVRPLGGIIFGHFGDRIGRKKTFTISILMMAFATAGIGLTPSFEMIGIASPIIIIILRIVQGLSVGGEIPGAITYVSESLPAVKGLALGIIFCALTMGIAIGSLIEALMVNIFSATEMQIYGFRIPFIAGGLLGFLSYLLRRGLHESSSFLAIENSIEKYPALTVIKNELTSILIGFFIVSLCAAIITSLFLFIPSYFTQILLFPENAYIWQRTATIAFGSCLTIMFGYMADVFNRKKLLFTLIIATALLAYPIFHIYVYYPESYVIAFMVSAILLGFSAGIVPSLLSELFPTKIRYSGIAISYNIGFAIFGGLTPFFSLSLIYYTGESTTPALYLIIVSVLAMIATLLYIKQAQRIDSGLRTIESESQPPDALAPGLKKPQLDKPN